MRVLLATCDEWPEGEPASDLLVTAFDRRGVAVTWASWDDPAVDWGAALVAVRSTWDYDGRREQFLSWARSVPDLLQGAPVFAWNTDKAYLLDLIGAGVPVVPTLLAADDAVESAVAEVLAGVPAAVVKPSVAAGGRGVQIVRPGDPVPSSGGPWVVQPLLESVRTEGETSVFVLGGVAVSQAAKRPGSGEIRVHEHLGGTTRAVALDAEAVDLAIRATEAAADLLERHLVYARVDMLRLADGTLVVGEVEATEPGLYLDVLPDNADHFAEAVIAHL